MTLFTLYVLALTFVSTFAATVALGWLWIRRAPRKPALQRAA